MKIILTVDGQAQELQLRRDGEELTLLLPDGRRLTARWAPGPDGTFWLEHDGRRWAAAGTALGGGERQVWAGGRTWRYLAAPAGARAAAAAEPLAMASPIPAVVREVLVAPGEQVSAGQKLLLLESMKMVLPVLASRDGRVRAIVPRPGEAVAPGVPLVELEEA